jgi:hypothetical protein
MAQEPPTLLAFGVREGVVVVVAHNEMRNLPLLVFAVREGVVVVAVTKNRMRNPPIHIFSKSRGGGDGCRQEQIPPLVFAATEGVVVTGRSM